MCLFRTNPKQYNRRCGTRTDDLAHPACACTSLWVHGLRGAKDYASHLIHSALAQCASESRMNLQRPLCRICFRLQYTSNWSHNTYQSYKHVVRPLSNAREYKKPNQTQTTLPTLYVEEFLCSDFVPGFLPR